MARTTFGFHAFGEAPFGALADTSIVVSNDIAFGQVVATNVTLDSRSNGVTFGQIVAVNIERQVAVANSVLLDDLTPVHNVTQDSRDNSVAFDDLTPGVGFERSASLFHDVAFDHVEADNVILDSRANSVAFTDIPNVERVVRLENSFGFLHQVQTNVIVARVEHSLLLDHNTPFVQQTRDIDLEHDLSLTHTMGPTIEESVSNDVAFGVGAFRAGGPVNNVIFDHTVVPVASRGVDADILFDHSVSAQLDSAPATDNGVVFNHDVVACIMG